MPCENQNFSPLTIQRVSVGGRSRCRILLCEIFIGQTNSTLQPNLGRKASVHLTSPLTSVFVRVKIRADGVYGRFIAGSAGFTTRTVAVQACWTPVRPSTH